MDIPKSVLEEIASEVNAFGNCYVQKSTLKIIPFPKYEYDRYLFLVDMFESINIEIYYDIEQNPQNYYAIEQMPSFEGYKLMQKFVEQVSNHVIREKLEQALNGKSPFANFKHIVKQEKPKEWYAFEETELIKYVENELRRQTE